MMTRTEYLIRCISEAGVTITETQASLLLFYYERLIETNKVMNLTAVTDFEEAANKHFADSLTLNRAIDPERVSSLIDIGTGAGFPGLPLAIVYPHIRVTLMDSLNKRIIFLENLIKELQLENVTAVHARAEDLARQADHREKYDLAVSRAVANLSTLAEYALPFVKVGGRFVSYKSSKGKAELAEADKAITALGGTIEKMENFTLFDMDRSLIVIKKVAKTPKKFPRKAGTPAKEPL